MNVLEPRLYQKNIAETCKKFSTLVVLPTGLGKTLIALLVMEDKLKKEKGKIIFLAPTKPLVEQHFSTVSSFFKDQKVGMLTGSKPKDKRLEIWNENMIFVATPQVIENDAGTIDIGDASLIVFDEAHRAVGNYAYVNIAEEYKKRREMKGKRPHTMGMTASPGSDINKIIEVCKNINIERIEIRSDDDQDVSPYISKVYYDWVRVDLPDEFKEIIRLLKEVYDESVNELKRMGLLRGFGNIVPKKELIKVGEAIRREQGGWLYHAATTQAIALKIEHGIELIETQSLVAFNQYFQRLKNDNTKARRTIMKDRRVIQALEMARSCTTEHKKVEKTCEVVGSQLEERKGSKIMVFAQYRDSAEQLVGELNRVHEVKAAKFIGQTNKEGDKGLRQKDQIAIMNKFREGFYNVLVATSVGEEGLDIPNTDMVVFYEPNPSEIRTIQRRGRTGRNMPGKVVFLITKGTRDEAFYWSSRRKEKKMKSQLKKLGNELSENLMKNENEIKKITKKKTKQLKIDLF